MLEGRIHWYDFTQESEAYKDNNGEPKSGWYWSIVDKLEHTETDLSGEHGPYTNRDEAEEACKEASITGDY